VAAVTGAQRTVGLIISKIGVALWKPGEVERGVEKGQGYGHNVFRVGEHDGRITPRAKELADILSVIDGSEVTDNLWGERWSKLCANAMGNPVTSMSGLGSLEVASSEVGRALTIHLAGECARVGIALGYRVPNFNGESVERWADSARQETWDLLDAMLTPKSATGRNWRASMAQDVAKGRPTEIDYMNGHVVAQGKTAGVPTPVCVATVEMVKDVEGNRRKPVPGNIADVLKRAGV
jgi:2-dehydropantoate 2-reductase